MQQMLELSPQDNEALSNLCGQLDEHLRLIESRLGIEIHNRGYRFSCNGEQAGLQAAENLLEMLYKRAASEPLDPHKVHLAIQEVSSGIQLQNQAEQEVLRLRKGVIRTRGPNQSGYVRAIQRHDINFGIGPAGTGKTYLAVACAVDALERDQVRRLILARPAVEAGERLGFLPGDLSQKVDPYLRPLYDALYDLFGFEKVARLMERNVIEIAPLAYMRGRTLNDAFIILDEAQNTTREQMKMFLTRIGFGSTAVITGDVTQIDLPGGVRSGLKQAVEILHGIDGISFTRFDANDVVRHPLVKQVVRAYGAHEASRQESGE